MTKDKQIVFYDGVCHFCNASVRFIIARDSQSRFFFSPIQSDYAEGAIGCELTENLNTVVLLKAGETFCQSDAVLEIAKDLDGYWYLLNVFKIFPKPIRDYLYKLFARNRYRMFGRSEVCQTPSQEVKARFLGIEPLE